MMTTEFRVDRVRQLRDHLKALPDVGDMVDGDKSITGDSFYMNTWAHKTDCGTTACAAGWTVLLFDSEAHRYFNERGDMEYPATHAAGLLGITEEQANVLFRKPGNFAELEPCLDLLIWTNGECDEVDLQILLSRI